MKTVDELCNKLILKGYSFEYIKEYNDFIGYFIITYKNIKIKFIESIFENVYNLQPSIFYLNLEKNIINKFKCK